MFIYLLSPVRKKDGWLKMISEFCRWKHIQGAGNTQLRSLFTPQEQNWTKRSKIMLLSSMKAQIQIISYMVLEFFFHCVIPDSEQIQSTKQHMAVPVTAVQMGGSRGNKRRFPCKGIFCLNFKVKDEAEDLLGIFGGVQRIYLTISWEIEGVRESEILL